MNTHRIIGYARVSTTDQKLDGQILALEKAGCTEIFQEKMSGANYARPELIKMLKSLQPGDTVITYKFDRFARSTRDLLNIVDEIKKRKAFFKSLSETVDTSTAMGQFFLVILGAFAELERSNIIQRTKQGIAAAKARGVTVGAEPKYALDHVKAVYNLGKMNGQSMQEIAEALKINRATLYRYVERIKRESESRVT